MATLQEKEDNKDNDQVENQEWLLDDEGPAPKHCPEQEGGYMTGKGIQKEEQGGQKQFMGINFDFDSSLSVGTIRTTVHPPIQREVNPSHHLLHP